jgi:tetratricopeptide (TPR) repeat protein
VYEKTGNVERAIEDHQRAVLLNPASAKPSYNLGAAYARKGLFHEALEALNRSIEAGPTPEAYINRGVVHAITGNPDEALRDLTRAIDLDPSSPDAFVNRGNLLLKAGRSEEARRDFQRACERGDAAACSMVR